MKYNGAIVCKKNFLFNENNYSIDRFLCILSVTGNNELAWYDINVIESQIGERLTDNEDLIGVELLPIASLFAGHYLCLDYRKEPLNPSVCVWNNEESGEFEPVTYQVANRFKAFLDMLT